MLGKLSPYEQALGGKVSFAKNCFTLQGYQEHVITFEKRRKNLVSHSVETSKGTIMEIRSA